MRNIPFLYYPIYPRASLVRWDHVPLRVEDIFMLENGAWSQN
jgi:hypothetical protein